MPIQPDRHHRFRHPRCALYSGCARHALGGRACVLTKASSPPIRTHPVCTLIGCTFRRRTMRCTKRTRRCALSWCTHVPLSTSPKGQRTSPRRSWPPCPMRPRFPSCARSWLQQIGKRRRCPRCYTPLGGRLASCSVVTIRLCSSLSLVGLRCKPSPQRQSSWLLSLRPLPRAQIPLLAARSTPCRPSRVLPRSARQPSPRSMQLAATW